jgi:hypothetical protein
VAEAAVMMKASVLQPVFGVEVKEPAVRHQVTMLQIRRWLDGATKSPNELVRKERLKRSLAL